jgi:hypothetical protein
MHEEQVDLQRYVQRAGEELGTWVRADYGLEVMCRGEDMLGSFWVRREGFVLTAIKMPVTEESHMPGQPDMLVWTDASPGGYPFGVVRLRGPASAEWWSMRV